MTIQRSNEPDAFRAFEQAGWDRVIEGYERTFGPLTEQTAEPLLDAAEVSSPCRVLDVCTGHGVLAAAAIRRGATVTGVDISQQVLNLARRNVPRADFRQSDAENLPFETNLFDAVVCGYGIIHLPAPDRALAEFLRVTRPGGRVAVSVWGRPSPANGFGMMLGIIGAHGRPDIPLPHGPDSFQFSDLESLTAALISTGFTNVTVTRVEQNWHMRQPHDFIDAILNGAVRGGALLTGQTPEALAAIKTAATARIDRDFRVAGGFAIPMDALIGSGSKTGTPE